MIGVTIASKREFQFSTAGALWSAFPDRWRFFRLEMSRYNVLDMIEGDGGRANFSQVIVLLLVSSISLAPLIMAEGAADRPLVLFLGDSLTAGYGFGEDQAFPRQVENQLGQMGLPVRVVNGGVSGDTSAGGLARLDWLLAMKPAVVVVELGGNDGLRGLDLEMTESNLRQILTRCRDRGSEVLLLGMRMPPNFGDYAERFEAVFRRLAEELEIPWVPFLLEGVGGHPELNLADGIHPNEEGHRILAANVTPALASLLRELTAD